MSELKAVKTRKNDLATEVQTLFSALGVSLSAQKGNDLTVRSPLDGSVLSSVRFHTPKELEAAIAAAQDAFIAWRDVPAPRRGELVRLLGEELRAVKEPLSQLVTIECGKIIEEGRGEVQEMIDICDFAVGLSRQLYGLTIASERPQHVMQENWLPLGVVGVISAFNFPVAVWAWNFALAIVCGDPVIWKPSEKTPLAALACQAIFERTASRFEKQTGQKLPKGLSAVIIGDRAIGEQLVDDRRVPLISATGSTRMGAEVGPRVAKRFGRSLLELGGNNAIIVTPSADLDVALSSILFGAVGTAGQRCTTTRRLFVHKSIYDTLFTKLKSAYEGIGNTKVGDPLTPGTLVGPLIDKSSFDHMQESLKQAKAQGGEVFFGERTLTGAGADAYYVRPAIVRMPKQTDVVCHETFAPILYVMPYTDMNEVLELHNAVPQGLSSAIFTTDMREAELFKRRSDCGIANVNIGTSGAEIGGAFGGEKETGGGRESGSDSWKVYMRRQTSTSYYGTEKPALAQGIRFGDE
ncbi:MAG: aldehyde dehydrogenase family protein [Alphaproteobacteria bacterium]|nr:aldehyde dehydrogenase family protein [Alphaproteobacteria bacterium]